MWLDVDKLAPTQAGLEFFYPRLAPAAYLCVHDYNNPESDWAVSRAVDAFFAGKHESPIALPDECGTVMVRKCR